MPTKMISFHDPVYMWAGYIEYKDVYVEPSKTGYACKLARHAYQGEFHPLHAPVYMCDFGDAVVRASAFQL
jgi:hypothetical protein